MAKDKRKAPRRPMRYSAWIALGGKHLHGCVLADVSDTGGRLDVEDTSVIPDAFTLRLASNGSATRKCKVVWRTARQLGVAFERVVFDADQVPLAPNIPVEIVSTETVGGVEPATAGESKKPD
jgi:hypothetical protein